MQNSLLATHYSLLAVRYSLLTLLLFTSIALQAEEPHLKNIRQLTFGGDNAEAYFSFDGKHLSFQSNNAAWGLECDQIFTMATEAVHDSSWKANLVSTGKGRTTCAYYMPGDKTVIFASTHEGGAECPPEASRDGGRYLWNIYDTYDIYISDLDGNIVDQLTDGGGYDAEAVVSPNGDKIVFTSTRSGDLELWTMNIDGSNQTQITHELGYDGGAFFSPDGTKLVFRSSRPKTAADQEDYKKLLSDGLVAPTNMEIYVCNVDGTDLQKVTDLGKANWAPYFHPSGEKIVFSSNHHSERGWDFQLFMINLDGTGLQQITSESRFNAFPMFSPDGKQIVFSSNRDNGGTRDTNVFIADWED